MHADSLLLHAPRTLAWVRTEMTLPGPGEVWVETLAGAVSVGTEGPLYRGDARATQTPSYPLMTGYESLARVVAVGEGVDLKRGDRVVATYGHRTAARVRADTLMHVPKDVPDEVALLAILSNDRTIYAANRGGMLEMLTTPCRRTHRKKLSFLLGLCPRKTV